MSINVDNKKGVRLGIAWIPHWFETSLSIAQLMHVWVLKTCKLKLLYMYMAYFIIIFLYCFISLNLPDDRTEIISIIIIISWIGVKQKKKKYWYDTARNLDRIYLESDLQTSNISQSLAMAVFLMKSFAVFMWWRV